MRTKLRRYLIESKSLRHLPLVALFGIWLPLFVISFFLGSNFQEASQMGLAGIGFFMMLCLLAFGWLQAGAIKLLLWAVPPALVFLLLDAITGTDPINWLATPFVGLLFSCVFFAFTFLGIRFGRKEESAL